MKYLYLYYSNDKNVYYSIKKNINNIYSSFCEVLIHVNQSIINIDDYDILIDVSYNDDKVNGFITDQQGNCIIDISDLRSTRPYLSFMAKRECNKLVISPEYIGKNITILYGTLHECPRPHPNDYTCVQYPDYSIYYRYDGFVANSRRALGSYLSTDHLAVINDVNYLEYFCDGSDLSLKSLKSLKELCIRAVRIYLLRNKDRIYLNAMYGI